MAHYKNRFGVVHSFDPNDRRTIERVREGELFLIEDPKPVKVEEETKEPDLREQFKTKFGKYPHPQTKNETIKNKLTE